MRFVTSTCVYPPSTAPERALRSLAAHIFEGADMAFDYYVENPENRIAEPDWREPLYALRSLSERLGVPYTHAHAPFDAGSVENADEREILRRTIEGAAILGARYIVVHSRWRDRAGEIIADEEQFIRENSAYALPLIDMAEAHGVTILAENLLWGASTDPVCLSDLVEAVDSPRFGWCYDTGHAHIFGYGAARLSTVRRVPLSLHIQDNLGTKDDHLIPGDGTVDWRSTFETLKRIGYKGDFVLEAHHQSLDAPTEAERDRVLDRLARTGRSLRQTYFTARVPDPEAAEPK